MVWFHVIDDKVIDLTVAKDSVQLIKELEEEVGLNSIYEGNFLVDN